MAGQFPYSLPFDLNTLTDRTVETRLDPAAPERAEIAKWLGADALDSLTAAVRLKRLGEDRFRYEAQYCADVMQSCVITLAPVRSHLEAEFSRDYRLSPGSRPRKPSAPRSLMIADLNAEEEETLTGHMLDLAAPVLEEISLSLDPYPRAPGATFPATAEEGSESTARAENPFAILERLKETNPGNPGGGRKTRTPPPKK
jgi:uncharacterized metal-binding protein YceD (DUF177 family)